MSVSCYAQLFYGVEFRESDLIRRVEHTIPAQCHPDEIEEGDKFCPECGNPAKVERTEIQVRDEVKDYLKPDGGDYDLERWLEGSGLKILEDGDGYASTTKSYLGVEIAQKGDLMYG